MQSQLKGDERWEEVTDVTYAMTVKNYMIYLCLGLNNLLHTFMGVVLRLSVKKNLNA